MPILTDPPDDGGFWGKPGRDWTPEERLRAKIWLNTPPQIRPLLGYTSHHLGRGSTADDAEEAWGTFCADRLDKTIDLYDARAPFVPFLLMRLRQFSWREGERIRARREEALERQSMDGNTHELVIVDSARDPERALELQEDLRLLQRCLSGMSPDYAVVVVRHHLDGEPVAEIARELGISEGSVKVRLHRARHKLRTCLGGPALTVTSA